MSEPQEKILAFDNQFHEFGTQTVEGVDCVSTPFPVIAEDANYLNLELTGLQIRELLSSIQIGAEWAYPDKSHQILFNFMKGLICAPETSEDSGCIEYSPSVSFIKYFPDNPYVSGDKAAGWNKEAWYRWDSFDTLFPDWLDNWLNGALGALTNYLPTDILFNIESIPINPIDAFLNGGGVLPKIEIRFSGSGVVEIGLLSFPLGGKAVIELDQEPNALDILTGGLLDPAAFIVELNRDILNFPPDEYPINNIEIPVETTGDHVLYIVFIPILDDSLIPVGFGGGFRGVELCGFEEQGSAGIETIVWDGCALKSITGGIETTIVTAAEIQACLDLPEPEPSGGGGGAAIKSTAYSFELPANQDTTSTTMVEAAGTLQNHQFTYPNALILMQAQILNTNAANNTFFELRVNDTQASPSIVNRIGGNAGEILGVNGVFSGLDIVNPSGISVYFRASATTARIGQGTRLQYTVLEYANVEDLLFVEDIRISGEELQKKIGGVWITVTDSLKTILDTIQSDVLNAASVASSAYSLATGAVSVNTSQQSQINSIISVNNTQNSRLSDLELDAAAQALTLATHTSQIASLQQITGILSFGDVWATNHDLNSSPYFWTMLVGTGYTSGQGFRSNTNGLTLSLSDARLAQNQVTHVFARIIMNSSPTGTLQWRVNGSAYGSLRYTGVGGPSDGWLRVPNVVGTTFQIEFLGFGDFYLRNLYFLGRGSSNPFV